MMWLIKSPMGSLMGEGLAVITVTGRKSGQPISTPINVQREGEIFTAISSRDRTWWRNLRDGASAQLHVAGKTINVIGRAFESKEDVKGKLTTFFTRHPVMAKYLNVNLDQDGSMNEADLEKVVNERVVIELACL